MSVHNGDRFLEEQIESILSQSSKGWILYIANDNSVDGSIGILQAYAKQYPGKIIIRNVDNSNFRKSFLQLACDTNIDSEYFAYADQDDIWDSDKLSVAVNHLSSTTQRVPALYCSRTTVVDQNNQKISLSPLFKREPSFANALIQNIGGGNTMVFNLAAKKLLERAGSDVDVPSHDWWTYMLVLGCGGRVFYDPSPYIRYRQHDKNLIGSNNSFRARLVRIKMLFSGRFQRWNDQNINALKTIESQLTPNSKILLNEFSSARSKSLLMRLFGVQKSGVYRQTILGNIALIIATILNKI